jgi:type I restriction enzyme S subunit
MKKLLPEVCTIQYGFPFDSAKFSDSNGMPLIRIRDVVRGYSETYTTEEYKSEYIVHENDLLIGMDGEFNIAKWGKTPALLNQRVCRLAPKDSIDKDYLFYFMPIALKRIEEKTPFVTVKHLSAKELNKIEIPVLSLEEQRKIAETLSKADKLIAFRDQQLAKLDEVVKARFVEMFGEPSSNPMGWLQTTVGAECYYIKDGPHKSLTDVGMENGYPFISVRNIVNGYIDFSTAKYISEADYKDAIKKCCPEKGDILYSKGGTTGIAKLVDIDIKFANWVHLAVLKFNHNEFNGSFFEKMLNCDYCYKQSQMLTKGIANRDLVLSAMAQIKIYKPPILLQNQFAAFVERVDQQKQTVQQSLEKLELMKKALMQEYFG